MRDSRTTAAFAFISFTIIFSPTGATADRVLQRIEVKTTAEKAWAAIGDFCGIKDWDPAVASCELGTDRKTLVRTLTLKNGVKIVEKEVDWSDRSRAYTYKILESSLPVENYISRLEVLPVDNNTIDILWTSAFKPTGPAAEAQKVISDIYLGGLQSLKERLESESK